MRKIWEMPCYKGMFAFATMVNAGNPKCGELKNMLENITLETLINRLGQPTRKIGGEYVWQCPYCMDSHKDNLKFNEQKGLLKCFADDSHARRLLSEINKQTGNNYQTAQKNLKNGLTGMPAQLSTKQLDENLSYMFECNNTLLSDEKALKHLEHKRGINRNTAEFCGIGIDKALHRWVLPIFKYGESKIIGFEYRPAILPNAIAIKRTAAELEAKKGITRRKGSISGMAEINCRTSQCEILTIVEGFFDGYALFQYLQEQEQGEYYHIVTPSNGISSLQKQMHALDFTKYKKVYLYIDADDKSAPVMREILNNYQFIEPIQLACCKDFNEHYLKCINKGV